jgi:hypothetical protein
MSAQQFSYGKRKLTEDDKSPNIQNSNFFTAETRTRRRAISDSETNLIHREYPISMAIRAAFFLNHPSAMRYGGQEVWQ